VLKNVPNYARWFRFQLFWATADGLHESLKIDPSWPHGDVSLNADNHRTRDSLVAHINQEIDNDPELARKLIPDYPPYGKRMLRDNHWYRMFKRPNVSLVDAAIGHVESDGIVTTDGEKHLVDVILMATGFKAARMLWPMEIYGKEGKSLRDLWGLDDPRAFLGVTIPGFPNFFVMYGPNTNLAHGGSIVFHTECQTTYIMKCLRELIESQSSSMECRTVPYEHYNTLVDEAHSRMVWTHNRVTSWYRNASGRVTQTSPWRLVDYWKMTTHFNKDDYTFR
jgi:4-hydroxyacetophenone monooxygenase